MGRDAYLTPRVRYPGRAVRSAPWTSPTRAEDEAFRAELRRLARRAPAQVPGRVVRGPRPRTHGRPAATAGCWRQMERRRAWQRKLNEGRWAAISWPTEWGGRDATVTQNVIYSETMARYRTPGIYNANGLWQIGPMIIRWGTDEQKDRWVPNILNADDHWCQGFSEPEAGSATWPTCAPSRCATATTTSSTARRSGPPPPTSPSGACSWSAPTPTPSPRAASTRASPRSSSTWRPPGIDVRPIRDIAGEEMFCEVFFDDARVPVDYRLGGEGEGWLVAMGTLGSERVGTAGPGHRHAGRPRRHGQPGPVGQPRRAATTPASGSASPGRPHPHRVHQAPQLPGPVQDPAPGEELARGPAGQAAVELPGPDPGRAGRRPARAGRAAGQGRGPTPSTAAPGTGSTCSSATRRSAPAPPRCRRTSSPTRRSRCPAPDRSGPRLSIRSGADTRHASGPCGGAGADANLHRPHVRACTQGDASHPPIPPPGVLLACRASWCEVDGTSSCSPAPHCPGSATCGHRSLSAVGDWPLLAIQVGMLRAWTVSMCSPPSW